MLRFAKSERLWAIAIFCFVFSFSFTVTSGWTPTEYALHSVSMAVSEAAEEPAPTAEASPAPAETEAPTSEPPSRVFPIPPEVQPASKVKVTSEYGPRKRSATTNGGQSSRIHEGIDLDCAFQPIVAVEGGTILYYDQKNSQGQHVGWGRVIILLGDSGDEHLYAHLAERWAKNNSYVHAGDKIGVCGTSGGVTGPHLHYEYFPGGSAGGTKQPVNPRPFLETLGLSPL